MTVSSITMQMLLWRSDRTAEPGGEQPLRQPDRVEHQRRLLDPVAGQVRAAGRAARPSPSPSARVRSSDEREPDASVPLAEQHARALGGRLGGRHPGTTPSTGRTRLPATTSTRVRVAQAWSSHASSARRSPTRSCGSAARSRCGNVTASRLVGSLTDPGSRPGRTRWAVVKSALGRSPSRAQARWTPTLEPWVEISTVGTPAVSAARRGLDQQQRVPAATAGLRAHPTEQELAVVAAVPSPRCRSRAPGRRPPARPPPGAARAGCGQPSRRTPAARGRGRAGGLRRSG